MWLEQNIMQNQQSQLRLNGLKSANSYANLLIILVSIIIGFIVTTNDRYVQKPIKLTCGQVFMVPQHEIDGHLTQGPDGTYSVHAPEPGTSELHRRLFYIQSHYGDITGYVPSE